MSFILTLNSTNVSNTNTNTTFKFNFINGGFTCKDYEMCISSITLPYSFFNVSSYYNNKTFSLIFPTAATTITYAITLPDGFYTITDINSYIQQQCVLNGAYLLDSSGNYVYFVKMVYDSTYYAVQFLYYLVPLFSSYACRYWDICTTFFWFIFNWRDWTSNNRLYSSVSFSINRINKNYNGFCFWDISINSSYGI